MSPCQEFFAEGAMVFDDAVMDEGDFASAIKVWMGVFLGGKAVGGPAGMADPKVPGYPAFQHRFS
jgi:hypothetical protein